MSKFDVNTAPVDGEYFVSAGGVARVIVGLAFVSYSVISTVNILGAFLWPLMKQQYGPVSLAYAVALAIAVIVTVIEWGTRGGINWMVVTLFDAPFTSYQTFLWSAVLVDYHFSTADNTIKFFGRIAFSIVWGVAVAKFGEALLVRKKKSSYVSTQYPVVSDVSKTRTDKRGSKPARSGDSVRDSVRDFRPDPMEAVPGYAAGAGYGDDGEYFARSDNQCRKR